MAGSGQMYTFSDTTTTARTISDVVKLIDPQDVPCVSFFGTNNQGKFRLRDFPNHKVEWLEDTLRVRTATLNEAMDTTETAMDVASGHGVRFQVGDVWRSDETGELIYVSAVTAGSDTITTVIRNWNGAMGGSQGTATSSITTATGLTYLYTARQEGADSTSSPFVTPTTNYNYSQIMHFQISVSDSEQYATTRYGIADTKKYQIMKALGGLGGGNGTKGNAGDLMIDLEKTFFYGQRIQRSSGVAGGMGGLSTFVTTNTSDLNAARLTMDTLLDQIQNCWSYGGKPTTIICNAFNKRLITSWFQDSVRTERSERTGGVVVNTIETEFGNLDVMLNRWCPSNEVLIVQRDLLGWVTLRDWQIKRIGPDGDGEKDQIVGEFSFVLTNEKAHARIYDTATS